MDAFVVGSLPILAESESNDMKKRNQTSKKPKAAPVNQRCFLYYGTAQTKLGFVAKAVSYRLPRQVKKVIYFSETSCYPICPRCSSSMEREYTAYCDRCGQQLSWHGLSRAEVCFPGEKKQLSKMSRKTSEFSSGDESEYHVLPL